MFSRGKVQFVYDLKRAYSRHEKWYGKVDVTKDHLDAFADDVRYVRSRLKCMDKDTVIDGKDNESYTVIYKKTMKWDGTKEELREYLWKECATQVYADYSPTGKWFTDGYKVAHLRDNEYRIAETFRIDV